MHGLHVDNRLRRLEQLPGAEVGTQPILSSDIGLERFNDAALAEIMVKILGGDAMECTQPFLECPSGKTRLTNPQDFQGG